MADHFDIDHAFDYRMKAEQLRKMLAEGSVDVTWEDVVIASRIAQALGNLESMVLFSEIQQRYKTIQKAKGSR